MDRILLTGALLFFMLVCIYILKKRILDRGVSVLSTILTPLTRTTKTIINSNNNNVQPSSTNDQIAVGSSDTSDQILTAAASAATAVAVSLIPGLVSSPDLPIPSPPHPSGNLPTKPAPIDAHPPSADPKQSIKPDLLPPSDHPVISNFELLHEEL
jgi:protein transport protein SEC20